MQKPTCVPSWPCLFTEPLDCPSSLSWYGDTTDSACYTLWELMAYIRLLRINCIYLFYWHKSHPLDILFIYVIHIIAVHKALRWRHNCQQRFDASSLRHQWRSNHDIILWRNGKSYRGPRSCKVPFSINWLLITYTKKIKTPVRYTNVYRIISHIQ